MRGRDLLIVAAVGVALHGALDAGVARADETVHSCGATDAGGVNHVFAPAGVFGINPSNQCSGNERALRLNAPGNQVARGRAGRWQANAPAGLQIVRFDAPSVAAGGVNDGGDFYGGGFYWNTGGTPIHVGIGASYGASGLSSGYLGFDLICEGSPCRGRRGLAYIYVSDIAMQVRETRAPYLMAGAGLWQAGGYVRGDWPLSFNGDSPSGVCALSATLNGQPVGSQGFPANETVWHQCAATGLTTTVHTTQYANGASALALHGSDAAQLATPVASYTKPIYIDNQQPAVALSGPADAPSTAGTQYITATGAAGPSGVSGFSCTIDGASGSYSGASARIPVSGLGPHTVTCAAANNSRDASGAVAVSAPVSHTISIRQPTVFGVGFTRIADALRCRHARERVLVPGRLVTVRRHHRLVHVRRRGHTRIVRVTRCHPRIERRRVAVFQTVTRGGKRVRVKRTKLERVVVLPHTVTGASRRVPYGHGTTVSGFLGTDGGVAIGGQTVRVLTAPDNGQGQFAHVATATTSANGLWSVKLPAGPSRLVQAVFDGAGMLEPGASAQVRVIVPASVNLDVVPRHTHWGATVSVRGRLGGGYVPAAGELVVFRVGYRGGSSEVGHVYAGTDGRFSTRFTFLHGHGSATYHFWARTVTESDYPYAPGTSKKVPVSVVGP